MQEDNNQNSNDSEVSPQIVEPSPEVAQAIKPSEEAPAIISPTVDTQAQNLTAGQASQDVFAPYSIDNKAGQAAATFVLGGTENVSRFMKFTKASLVFYFIWLFLALCLVGLSYLHYKHGYSWLHTPFLAVTVISVLNIIYFGWIRRELVSVAYRSIIPDHTVRGGTAFSYSFLFLASVAIIAGVGWNIK